MLKKIAVAAALAIAASTAAAAEVPAYYFGVDAGSTKLDGVEDREGSIGLFAGYQFHKNIAVEGTYRRLADVVTDEFGPTANLKFDQLAISAIGSMPFGSFTPYARLGYNNINVKAKVGAGAGDADESGVLYGLGLGYKISQYMSARVEVQKPTSDTTNVSFGMAFTF